MSCCVITGSSNGLGLCLARAFAAAGHEIIGIDRDPPSDAGPPVVARGAGSIRLLTADLANHSELAHLTGQLAEGPPINVLIHNAGINWVGRFEECDLCEQDQIIEVNLIAPMILTSGLLSRRAIPADGSIVFVSSLSCQISYPGAAVYAASKNGVASYASSLSASSRLHVLTVYPGPLRTEMARRWSPSKGGEEKRMPPERLARQIVHCVRTRRRTLIPGIRNRCLALLGNCCPTLTEFAMKKAILEKLN